MYQILDQIVAVLELVIRLTQTKGKDIIKT